MDQQYPFTSSPQERDQRRAERNAARKKRQRHKRRKIFQRLFLLAALILLLTAGLARFLRKTDAGSSVDDPGEAENIAPVAKIAAPEIVEGSASPYSVSADANTARLGDELVSQYAILIDLENDVILAEKGADIVISPASMTKILTVLVAAEAIKDESQLDDTVTIDREITDYTYTNDCSVAGFAVDESVTVRDLFYGTILPSGADASLALAEYVAGSHEAFVDLMNEKVEELGLSDTAHFTNCVGLYDEKNVCTVYDMAMIMKAALENDLSRQALTTRIYDIAANEYHPEGMTLSNWFLRRIEDHVPDGIQVLGAKTGYVYESGNCAVSYAETSSGGRFICVTGDSTSSWRCIKDHVQIYEQFCAATSAAEST